MKKTRALIFIFILFLFTAGTAHAAEWKNDAKGWWYLRDDGSHPANEWSKIEGAWYHFDNMGYMQTGWIQDGGKYYCLNKGGDMLSNIWIDGKYYLGKDGAMLTNTYTPEGYKVNAEGLWELKELELRAGWYYNIPPDIEGFHNIDIADYGNGNYTFAINIVNNISSAITQWSSPITKGNELNTYYANGYMGKDILKITVLSDKFIKVEDSYTSRLYGFKYYYHDHYSRLQNEYYRNYDQKERERLQEENLRIFNSQPNPYDY